MSTRGYRRPPSRAWLKKYPQRSNPSLYQARPRPARTYRPSVARTRGAAVQETRYFDNSQANTILGSTWTGSEIENSTGKDCLFAPQQGSAVNERQGRKAVMKALRIRGTISLPAQSNQTATEGGTQVRVVLFQDMQTNGAQAQGEEVMTDYGANPLTNLQSFQNLANVGRFKVWKDKTYVMGDQSAAYDGTNMEFFGQLKTFKWNIKFRKPIVVNFKTTSTGTVSDIVDNSFHMLAISSNVQQNASVAWNCRVPFYE